MVIFSSLINFIEAFFMALFTAKYFSLKKQRVYISLLTMILFALSNYTQFVQKNDGIMLSVSMVSIVISSVVLWTRSFHFEYVYISVLYHFFIVLISIMSYTVGNSLSNFIPLTPNQLKISLCVLAKLGQIVLTLCLLRKQINIAVSFDLNRWKSVVLMDVLLLAGLIMSIYALVVNNYSISMFRISSVIFLAVMLLFRYTIKKIEKLNQEKLEARRLEEQNRFKSKQLSMMEYLKNEINATDHRMNYLLLQMKRYIENDRIDDMKELLDKYADITSKYKLVIDTGNSVFDCFFSLKVNELMMEENNVETSIFIQPNPFYNDMNFINTITQLLDYFKCCKDLYISMKGKGQFVVLHIIYRGGKVNLNALEQYLKMVFPDKENLLSDDIDKKGIRIVIDLERYYGK